VYGRHALFADGVRPWLVLVQGGAGVERNYTEALSWLERAAALGNASAQVDLARCYLQVGVTLDTGWVLLCSQLAGFQLAGVGRAMRLVGFAIWNLEGCILCISCMCFATLTDLL